MNKRDALALMAKINSAGALIRLSGDDQEAIDEFARLADLAVDAYPTWTSFLVASSVAGASELTRTSNASKIS